MKNILLILLAIALFPTIRVIAQNESANNGNSILPDKSFYYSLSINNTVVLSVKENNDAACRINSSMNMGVLEYDKDNKVYSFVSHNRSNNFEFTFVRLENGIKINSWKNPPVNINKDVVLTKTDNPQNETEIFNSWFTKKENKYQLSLINARLLNDKANFLCQSNCFSEALLISGMVMKYAPNLIETYVTRGDAFWGTGDKDKASINYKNYVDIMKACHREYKIPALVLERLNDIELSRN